MNTSKWKTDFQTGKQRRTKATNQLNQHLTDMILVRRHEHLKTMRINEKVKNNTTKNRTEQVVFLRAMGLDYLIKPTETPLLIRFSDDPGFYIKVPSEFCNNILNVNKYLESIQHYQVLFVQKKNGTVHDRYYGPVSLSCITKNCTYYLSSTKGNKNRLQFRYNLTKQVYDYPEDRTLFSGNLVNRINDLN